MGNNKNRKKNKMRSALSGRIINGKEVILVSEAKEYLKKQGYEIRMQKPLTTAFIFGLMFLSMTLLLVPFTSAITGVFSYDFTQQTNILLFGIYLAIALILLLFQQKLWSGLMIVFAGIFMALNDVNVIMSMLILGVGIVIISSGGDS